MTLPAKINNLIDYFRYVRKMPGMYLGNNTITKLHDHLQGYSVALGFNDIINPIDRNFFDNFNDFVYHYYGITTTAANWKDVILEQSFDREQLALDTFFELFDMFVEKVRPINNNGAVLAFLDKMIFDQDEMKAILGSDFSPILKETVHLIKDNVMTNIKRDYDYIFDQLNEKSEQIPELRKILDELGEQCAR